MDALALGSHVVLWALVVLLGFLLLGTLRALGLLRWRLEQLEATTPPRLGRDGLKPGKKAPGFVLPSVTGSEVALFDFAGRKVLLVFVQGGCGPCHQVVPELNLLRHRGEPAVLAVFNGPVGMARKWAVEVKAEFSVLSQEQFALSKRYQVFATPFAFLIGTDGVIESKGIVNNGEHVGYVLAGRGTTASGEQAEVRAVGAEEAGLEESSSLNSREEVGHV
jgi:methylamine dehydrogenase accessory protein MauD